VFQVYSRFASGTGTIIDPQLYHEALPGALVRVSFELTHYSFDGPRPSSKTFTADVKSIRILVNPPPIQKHKAPQVDPGFGSPMKKSRMFDSNVQSKCPMYCVTYIQNVTPTNVSHASKVVAADGGTSF
jgi:hypothetical protein